MGVPIFMRPVEVAGGSGTGGAWLFTINDGGGIDDIEIPVGTYGNGLSILWDINAQLVALAGSDVSLTLNSDMTVTIANTSGTLSIVWIDAELRDFLGFTSTQDVTGETSVTSGYTISHIWLPTGHRANQEYFQRDHSRSAHGGNSANGIWSGFTVDTDDVRNMSWSFQYEPALNIDRRFAINDLVRHRQWDWFIDQARSVAATVSTNPSPKGFYYYEDSTDAVIVADVTTNEGLDVAYTVSPSTHVFCHLTQRQASPRPALSSSLDRWNVEINAVSVTPTSTPTWTTPS